MAHIDELVAQIADSTLRELIAEQVKTLTSRKEFGLVFQQHSPETVLLPKQLVRTGDTVVLREAQHGTRFRVIRAKGDEARIIKLDGSDNVVEGADSEVVDRSGVVVIKDVKNGIYPGLKLIKECGKSSEGRRPHVVIKGENYHALRALEYTHRGKVDLIYIDPPYNTGAADWKYNDKFIDSNDAYRHSKWLSFMQKRLEVAKELLKDTGVLIMAIDDNEHARLKMLADQVFGESNFLANVVWQGGKKNDARYVSVGHDYMIAYAKNESILQENKITWRERKPGIDEVLDEASRIWSETKGNHKVAQAAYREWMKKFKSQGIATDAVTRYVSLDDKGNPIRTDMNLSSASGATRKYEIIHPVTGNPVKTPSRGWGHTKENLLALISAGKVHFGPDESKVPSGISYLRDLDTQVLESVFVRDRNASGRHLGNILGDKRFPFPKDHNVLMRWMQSVAPKDATIIDFFAGSGTTAEAVIRLNEEDGGTRQSILVTNNELSRDEDKKLRKLGYEPGDDEYEAQGVFHHVTMPRISTVLSGIREDNSTYSEGISGQSAKFYELTYEDENLVSLGHKFEAVAPLLWMQAGCGGEVIDKIATHSSRGIGYTIREDANYAVIFNIDAAGEAVSRLSDAIEYLFIVTDSTSEFQSVIKLLPSRIQGNTHMLYSDYLRSFAIRK